MGTLRDFTGASDRRAARDAAQQAALQRFNLSGPGGSSFGFDPSSGTGSINLGDMEGIRSMLLGSSVGNMARGGQVSPLLGATAGGSLADLSGDMGLSMPGTLQAPGFDFGGTGGFDRELEGLLRGAATDQLGIVGADPFDLAQDRLGLLREQAQPFEDRAFNRLQDNLFGTGRLGSSGGALQTEAFARGLGQADLQRQGQATDFARGLQSDAAQRMQMLLGERLGTRGMEEQLRHGQFGRELGGFGANLESRFGAFDRNLAGRQFGAGLEDMRSQRARSRFDIANQLVGTNLQAEGQRFGQALHGIGGATGIDANALQQFMAALQTEQARSNSRLGGSQTMANLSENSGMSQFGRFIGNITPAFS